MMRFIFTTLLVTIFFFTGVSASVVHATEPPPNPSPGGQPVNPSPGGPNPAPGVQGDTYLINPLGDEATLESFLMQLIELFIRIGTLVLITMIIYIGFLFVAAQGAPEKISNARNMLLWTLIGGLILLGAQAISTGIQATVTEISKTAPAQPIR